MHREVMDWLRGVQDAHPELFSGVRVLECGAFDINGSPRPLFRDCEYVGLDWRPGPGVDVVSLVHAYEAGEPFDVVISTEMLEHDPYWVASVQRMSEMLRPGGVLLLTWAAPRRGAHELATAPIASYYRGLAPGEVAEAVRPYFETVESGLARGELDGWLVGWFARERVETPRMVVSGTPEVKLSVIIPAVGNVALTRRCVESVRALSVLGPEIVLVDNGSTAAEGWELAGLLPDVMLSHPEMLGYPKAINWGVRAASGEFVCLLNNDTEIMQRGWDARLVSVLETIEGAAMVAPVTDFAFNPGQAAGGPAAALDELLETDRLVFVCVVMRRALFDALGGLDEGFGLGNWEDTDMSWRVRERGGRLLIDPATFVRHVGHQTFATKVANFGELLETNRQRFMEKWKIGHPALAG